MTKHITADQLQNLVAKVVGFFDQGRDSVTEDRFTTRREQVRGRDGDPGFGSYIGDIFTDSESGLTLIIDKFFDEDFRRVNGKRIKQNICYLGDVHVIDTEIEKTIERIGSSVDEAAYRACMKEPKTPAEIEAASALFDELKKYFGSGKNTKFEDRRTNKALYRKKPRRGVLKLALI